jgi:hypothetical protein
MCSINDEEPDIAPIAMMLVRAVGIEPTLLLGTAF